MVHSLSIEFEIVDGRWLAVAPWGTAEGATWEEAYAKLMKVRPR